MITGREEEFRLMFVQEAEGQLRDMAQLALDLESVSGRPEALADLFRHAHTLKSSSMLVGFDAISVVAHALEDLFDELRSGQREPDKAVVDAILAAVDTLQEMVPALMGDEGRSDEAGIAAARLRSVPRPAGTGGDETGAAPGQAAEAGHAPPTDTDLDLDSAYLTMPVERLDTIVRLAGEAVAARLGIGSILAESGVRDPDSVAPYSSLTRALDSLQREALKARMVSFATVAGPLRRAVRDVAAEQDKSVRWELSGQTTELDRHILELLRDPLLHLVRNATGHGIEPADERVAAGKPPEGVVRVSATSHGHEVLLTVADDGRGLDFDALRRLGEEDADPRELIFRPGVSTAAEVTALSGRGVGLDVVRTALTEVRGTIEVKSEPGRGTEFRIAVPMTLALMPCLIAAAGGEHYAIPLHAAEGVLDDPPEAELIVEGRPSLRAGDELVPVTSLSAALGREDGARGPAVVLAARSRRHAFRVDELIGRREVVVKELGPVVGALDVVVGATVEPDGSLMLVLDPAGLVTHGRTTTTGQTLRHEEAQPSAPARVLVVDDAITFRELQRSMLERAGYVVETAADGEAALGRLAKQRFDLVLTDIEMPRMDGFLLTETIRSRPALAGLPVIIITSRADEAGRRRGVDVGANGYMVKNTVDEPALLEIVERTLRAAA